MDRLGVEHVIVVGHSSGGNTATALAEQRPDLVTALALINTGPRMEALIATPDGAIELSQWPHLTDDQLRQAARTGYSCPGSDTPPTWKIRHGPLHPSWPSPRPSWTGETRHRSCPDRDERPTGGRS